MLPQIYVTIWSHENTIELCNRYPGIFYAIYITKPRCQEHWLMTHRRHEYLMRIEPKIAMVLQQVMQHSEYVNYKVTNRNGIDFTPHAIYISQNLELTYTDQIFDVGWFDRFMGIFFAAMRPGTSRLDHTIMKYIFNNRYSQSLLYTLHCFTI